MSKLVDINVVIDAICNEWCGVSHKDCRHPFNSETDDYYWCDACETVLSTLPNLPSAEPELEIIRCKDCKHSRYFNPCFYCYEFGEEKIVPENGFCFMSERRAND